MNDLQKKLLEMLSWFCEYLNSNDYTYYVVYGSFLGAMRHSGFIPWDDDIDIALPRPEYQRLIKEFNKKEGNFMLETPFQNNNDYLLTYSKLYDTSTTLIEKQRKSIKRGIYIDVFPIDGLGNTYKESIAFSKRIMRMNNLLMSKTCAIRKERSFLKNIFIIMGRCLFFINTKKYSLKIDKAASKKDYDKCQYVGCLYGSYGKREVFKKEVFGKAKPYPFENIVVKGPENGEMYLTQLYNNWKMLPEKNKRGKQHDFQYLDLEKPFLG